MELFSLFLNRSLGLSRWTSAALFSASSMMVGCAAAISSMLSQPSIALCALPSY